MCDLLSLEVMLHRSLHKLHDLFLDGVVAFEDRLVGFLHLEFQLIEEGVVKQGGV